MPVNDVDKAYFWDNLYKNNESGWDLKSANPVFVEILKGNKILNKGKLLIPGCGKGYDALAAAESGYEVTAVDFSSEAINFAKTLAGKVSANINFIQEDIFNLGAEFENYFDSIYEYTTYCAINPERHDDFAKKISSLLKKGGVFLTILFPVEKREGGPPFGVDPLECISVFSKYLKLSYFTKDVNSIKPRKGREVIQLYTK